MDRTKIQNLVRERLLAAIQKAENDHTSPSSLASNLPSQPHLSFVNEQIVREHKDKGKILVTANAIITPSARDMADRMNIRLESVVTPNIELPTNLNPQAIVIGADHGGYTLKEIIKKELKKMGHTVIDVGTHSTDSVDYPDYAYAVANCVASGQCKRGIMIDGVGIGSAMLANKIKGIRAANCHNIFEIKNSRAHNDANILTLGGRVLGDALAVEMVKVWLETSFEGGRHQKRIDKIMKWD